MTVTSTHHEHGLSSLPHLIAYVVSPDITLAGQPEPSDWKALVDLGYTTVLNIRGDVERAEAQAASANAAGLRYIYLPLPAYMLELEHIEPLRCALQDPANGKLFFHCRTATRVALLWMLYRMEVQGWSYEQARDELKAAGYDEDRLEAICYCADDYLERK
jgi:uncharacterized protein (TIGR01244 family)